MIVLSQALLLEPSPQVKLDTPILLWESVVTGDNVEASSELDDYPAANLATDSTIEVWRAGTTGPVTINVSVNGHEIDAVGIARHNFGSSDATVTIEALVGVEGGENDWVEMISPQILADDSPALFRFPLSHVRTLRVRIEGGTVPASAAVLYAGKLLVMPHGISAGHVPLDQAHDTRVANGRSEAGHFLGRIITGQSAQTTASFDNLEIDWYYEAMEPFVNRGTAGPFFFAWLPMDRPDDVGFAWLNSDPKPSMGSIYFNVSLDYGGITW